MACTALCVLLLGARALHYRSGGYLFLLWNLVLAWAPYGLSRLLASRVLARVRGGQLATLTVWLLFFPNAPYLVTDFVHLRARPPVPLWYDVGLLAAFAWTGMLLALGSLHLVHVQVRSRFGALVGWVTAAAASALAGVGIYIGRFLRWNSWDAVLHPGAVADDVLSRFAHPLCHPRSWGVTFVFGALFLLTYFAWSARERGVGVPSRQATELS